jgi:hypothetical protein
MAGAYFGQGVNQGELVGIIETQPSNQPLNLSRRLLALALGQLCQTLSFPGIQILSHLPGFDDVVCIGFLVNQVSIPLQIIEDPSELPVETSPGCQEEQLPA